jgi:hypothetical protein
MSAELRSLFACCETCSSPFACGVAEKCRRADHPSLLSCLRRLAGRWIATPWWNLRFSLGMWVGGFTRAERDYD